MILSPVQGMRPRITQKFGKDFKMKNGKYAYRSMGMKGHNGLDYGVPVGTPIFASHDGEVVKAVKSNKGYGNHVKLRSRYYARETVYGHLSELKVKVGDTVAMGDLIGLSGNTGFSTAPHLHHGYRNLIISDLPLKDWSVKNIRNGYFGYIDVSKYTIEWEGTHTLKKVI
jgi:murein DD-endopeptidase MepM/ murein hydrolase activator NlpD